MSGFLSQIKGVVHVGASFGHERYDYAEHDLDVLWIEPIYDVFKILSYNLKSYPKQQALRALITDKDGEIYTFHLADNNGESSSIFNLKVLLQAAPGIKYVADFSVDSKTLDSLDTSKYDALVIDAQGAEMLVLRGAINTLKHMKFVQAEAYSQEMYEGAPKPEEIKEFMAGQGFQENNSIGWGIRTKGKDFGSGYELIFERKQ